MPLPRYDNNAVPFQAVSPVGYSAQAQTMNTLSDRLERFVGYIGQVGREQKEIDEYKTAIKNIQGGNIEAGINYVDKAYSNVGDAALMSGVENDIKTKADELNKTAKSADEVQAVMQKYTNTVVSNIQNPTQRQLIKGFATDLENITSVSVAKRTYENVLKSETESIAKGIDLAKDEYTRAFVAGDEKKAALALTKTSAYLKRGVELGSISASAVSLKFQEIQKEAVKVKMQADYINAEASGNAQSFIKDNVLNNPNMLPSERIEALKFVKNYTDEKYNALSSESKGNTELIIATSKNQKTKIMQGIVGGNPISQQDLQNLVIDGLLLPNDLQDVQEFQSGLKAGSLSSDQSVFMNYQINIESASIQKIASDNRLTAKDKVDLIKRVQSYQQQERSNKALSDSIKGFTQLNGKSPYAIATEKLGAEIRPTINMPSEKQKADKAKLDILNDIRSKVSSGQIGVLDVPAETDRQIKAYQERTTKERAMNKYNLEVKEYDKKYEEYKKKQSSMFGQIANTLGFKDEAPIPPIKPKD